MFEQLGLVGCGLMGGSFALALKRAGLVRRVQGYSPSARTRQRAVELGVIDEAVDTPQQAAQGSDLVLLAVPVAATLGTLQALQPHITPTMLVMDVGSTKQDVVSAAQTALGDALPSFVPAHPVTGREVAGVDHALADLYQGSQVILTPLPCTREAQLGQARAVWSAIGARVLSLSPQAHDEALAAVSHLPHLLAFAFINALANQEGGAGFLALAGPGFRDFSRIAASEPSIWRDILLANQKDVLAQSRRFRQELEAFEALIAAGDATAITSEIARASTVRSAWRSGQSDSQTPATTA